MSSSSNVSAELMKGFDSAKSAKEMLKEFNKLEKRCHDDEVLLGLASLQLTLQLNQEAQDPEKLLIFGNRALKTLIDTQSDGFWYMNEVLRKNKAVVFGELLNMLGGACYGLGRSDESLSYLNWAYRSLCKLELDQSCHSESVLHALVTTHKYLFRVKVRMERKEELVVHAKKILEIQEKILKEDCMELGKAYEDVSYSYFVVENFKEALPFCLKAVEIQAKHLGQDSVEVALLRTNLGIIYRSLEGYEKAIEQNQLAQSVFQKERRCGDVSIETKLANGDMLMHLGRYEEAVAVLKGVVSTAAVNEIQLATAFISIARAFCGLEKFVDAKKHMKLALRLFDKKGVDPAIVDTGLVHMMTLYEKMNDFQNAISMLLRLLTIKKIPQEILREYSTRHAELIMRKEKAVAVQGPSEEDKLDEAFALLNLIKENIYVSGEEFYAKNTESINSKDRKPSSSH